MQALVAALYVACASLQPQVPAAVKVPLVQAKHLTLLGAPEVDLPFS